MSNMSGTEDFFVFMVKYWPTFLTTGPAPFAFIAYYSFLIYPHILHVFNRVTRSKAAECFKNLQGFKLQTYLLNYTVDLPENPT